MSALTCRLQIRPLLPYPIQISRYTSPPTLYFSLTTKTLSKPLHDCTTPTKSHPAPSSQPQPTTSHDDGIPVEDVKIISRFKSRHNYIRVLEVSRKADHPLAGSRLLLLDDPGNIHSMSFRFTPFTGAYYDIFATLPPVLPRGPIAILGFGAGSTSRLILELYPDVVVHGWELDQFVIDVGREFFGLDEIESQFSNRLFIHIGNALTANVKDGFAGIIVDLFSQGSLIPELQDPNTWKMLTKCLKKGGRMMVNVGGSCVEAEDKRRDGKVVMDDTLNAMHLVFEGRLSVSGTGNQQDDSAVALTGELPDIDAWKEKVSPSLRPYVDLWKPFRS